MRLPPASIALAATALLVAFGGCTTHVAVPPVFLSVAITPRPSSIAQGTSVILTATVSNRQITPQWSILDASYTATPGTLTPISGSKDSILYTAPPSPPIYTQTPTGLTQGAVTVDVAVSDPAGTTTPTVPDSISLVVTSPSVAVDLTPSTANLALGGTAQFFGYALGSTNNIVTWLVNGQTGGSASTGTISSAGAYVAPANLPMGGNTVTVTVISLADPTKSASAVVTLH